MADDQIPRQKRVGNYYIPERIRQLEPEIAARYAAGESARALAAEYGMSKVGIQSAARRQGVPVRGKPEAGALFRTRTPTVPVHPDPTVSLAMQVAWHMGYESSYGLSNDREFRTACAREARRRNPDVYRKNEAKRKAAENRIPSWADRKALDAFWTLASELGLEVDHIAPLQGEIISGLNVISNLQMLPPLLNSQKFNKFEWGPDYTILPYVTLPIEKGASEGAEVCASSAKGRF